jgi:hypothetical protein
MTTPTNKKKKRKRLKPDERRKQLRERLWPGSEELIWDRRRNDGWITIPKVLSLICALLKQLAKNDPTRIYIDLWCRSYDEGIIENIDEDKAAFSSGYFRTRASRTWRDHIRELEKLGFIKIATEGNNQIAHILLVNPLYAVDALRKRKKIDDDWWNAYSARANEIGAVLPSDEVEDESRV